MTVFVSHAYDDLPPQLRPIVRPRKPGGAMHFRCLACGQAWLGKHPSVCPRCLSEEHEALLDPRSEAARARLKCDKPAIYALSPPPGVTITEAEPGVGMNEALAYVDKHPDVVLAFTWAPITPSRGGSVEEPSTRLYAFCAVPTHACDRCRKTMYVEGAPDEFGCPVCKVGRVFRL